MMPSPTKHVPATVQWNRFPTELPRPPSSSSLPSPTTPKAHTAASSDRRPLSLALPSDPAAPFPDFPAISCALRRASARPTIASAVLEASAALDTAGAARITALGGVPALCHNAYRWDVDYWSPLDRVPISDLVSAWLAAFTTTTADDQDHRRADAIAALIVVGVQAQRAAAATTEKASVTLAPWALLATLLAGPDGPHAATATPVRGHPSLLDWMLATFPTAWRAPVNADGLVFIWVIQRLVYAWTPVTPTVHRWAVEILGKRVLLVAHVSTAAILPPEPALTAAKIVVGQLVESVLFHDVPCMHPSVLWLLLELDRPSIHPSLLPLVTLRYRVMKHLWRHQRAYGATMGPQYAQVLWSSDLTDARALQSRATTIEGLLLRSAADSTSIWWREFAQRLPTSLPLTRLVLMHLAKRRASRAARQDFEGAAQIAQGMLHRARTFANLRGSVSRLEFKRHSDTHAVHAAVVDLLDDFTSLYPVVETERIARPTPIPQKVPGIAVVARIFRMVAWWTLVGMALVLACWAVTCPAHLESITVTKGAAAPHPNPIRAIMCHAQKSLALPQGELYRTVALTQPTAAVVVDWIVGVLDALMVEGAWVGRVVEVVILGV
ncbi:hypothetical protein BC828DRAFT_380593 [Blastocladiella britannica]|nr:hypothetical protein BC828DRAFT_380593 [Blastocladiella britannica]